MIKSYKYKIRRPSKAIVEKFEQTLEICRELYNAGLQERRDAWKLNKVRISCYEQFNQLPEIKEVREDLKSVHSQVLRDPIKRLDRTFEAFFNKIKNGEKTGYPRFKGQNRFNSFSYTQSGFWLDGNKLKLSKIGTVRIRLSREVEGKIKTCTIKREADGWFVIFTVETNKQLLEKSNNSVGIDIGLENFATFSNGEKIENPRFLRKSERRLKTSQRSVTRKENNSNNRKKAVKLLRKQHLKIKRQRLDFIHKLTKKIIKEYDEIAVEELQISNLMKNHYLAKSIADAGWGLFLQALDYKAEEAGKRVWKVNANNTSQICSGCGSTTKKSLRVRFHKCSSCGLVLNRDENAAKNILGRADRLRMSQATGANEARILTK